MQIKNGMKIVGIDKEIGGLDVLLISPSIRKSLSYGIPDGISKGMSKNFGLYPWLGLCYIAACLCRDGISVEMIDMDAENLSQDQVVEKIKILRPKVVGISSMSFTFLLALELAKKIKKNMNTTIVLGGNHVSIYPQEVISHDCIDVGVIGEGEITFIELVKVLKSKALVDAGEDLQKINGIIYKTGKQIVTTKARKFVDNLDILPYPAVDLLKIERYYGCNHNRPYLTMVTSRGCLHRCSFCSKQPWNLSFRMFSAERIVSEIEFYINRLGVKAIDFFDDTFTFDQGRLVQVINLIKAKNIKFDFGFMTRVDKVNKKLLLDLKEIGCKIVSFGVESGSPRILNILNKDITISQIKDAFRWANEAKISTVGFFMVGNPGETMEDVNQTKKLIKELDIDYIKANILIPYPGSRLYDDMLNKGEIEEDYWKKITLTGKCTSVLLANRQIIKQKLIKIRNFINYMPYLRWKSNIFKIKKVKSIHDIKRTFRLLKNTYFDRDL